MSMAIYVMEKKRSRQKVSHFHIILVQKCVNKFFSEATKLINIKILFPPLPVIWLLPLRLPGYLLCQSTPLHRACLAYLSNDPSLLRLTQNLLPFWLDLWSFSLGSAIGQSFSHPLSPFSPSLLSHLSSFCWF